MVKLRVAALLVGHGCRLGAFPRTPAVVASSIRPRNRRAGPGTLATGPIGAVSRARELPIQSDDIVGGGGAKGGILHDRCQCVGLSSGVVARVIVVADACAVAKGVAGDLVVPDVHHTPLIGIPLEATRIIAAGKGQGSPRGGLRLDGRRRRGSLGLHASGTGTTVRLDNRAWRRRGRGGREGLAERRHRKTAVVVSVTAGRTVRSGICRAGQPFSGVSTLALA